jgi:hypothetical protein
METKIAVVEKVLLISFVLFTKNHFSIYSFDYFKDEPTNVCRAGNYTCPPEFFKCGSGRCINKEFVCDGGNLN